MRVCCKIRFKLSYLVKLYILNCILYYSLEFFKSHFGFILQDIINFFAFSLLSLRFLYYLPFSIFHAHKTHIHTCIHSSFPSIFASRPVSLLTIARILFLFSNRLRKPLRRVIVLFYCVNRRQILCWLRTIPLAKQFARLVGGRRKFA